jgi:hypothetical protein
MDDMLGQPCSREAAYLLNRDICFPLLFWRSSFFHDLADGFAESNPI